MKNWRINIAGSTKQEAQSRKLEAGVHLVSYFLFSRKENNKHRITNNKCKSELKFHTKYKTLFLLPRERFYTGVCPGAAAITTIISFLFSSPRISPNWESEFPTPTIPNAGVGPKEGCQWRNSGSRRATRLAHKGSLPVINQQALHRSFFVPLVKGDEIRFSKSGGKNDQSRFTMTGGPGDKTPGTSGVMETSLKTQMKGFKTERRYVTNSKS